MHLGAQYMAASAVCFNAPSDDDRHTSLHWNPDVHSLQLDLPSKELRLGLSYSKFALEFRKVSNALIETMELAGRSHEEIVAWIRTVLGQQFRFEIHYKIPYSYPEEGFRFDEIDNDQMADLRSKRELANDALEAFRLNLNDPSPVCTWPHHFDTSVSENLGNGQFMGFGMAIPDEMVSEFYFYAYAYDGNNPVNVDGLQDPGKGEWVTSKNFKGAVMSAANADKASVMSFFYTCHKLLNERLLVS
mgnify:CR=1 FL=1